MKPLFEMPELLTLGGEIFNGQPEEGDDDGTSCAIGCTSGCRSGCDKGDGIIP